MVENQYNTRVPVMFAPKMSRWRRMAAKMICPTALVYMKNDRLPFNHPSESHAQTRPATTWMAV